MTTKPWEAQKAVRGVYPSRFHPLPWENSTIGRLVPVDGAETRTSRGIARLGADSSIGATETTGVPVPTILSRMSTIGELIKSSFLFLLAGGADDGDAGT